MDYLKHNHVCSDASRSCSGCGACVLVCPHKAPSISMNKYGFYEASVNESLCIDCGICQKACIKYISEISSGVRMSDCLVYGCYSSNPEIQSTTTSGGLGYEIAKWGIENGYKIMGVEYDYADHRARHTISDTLSGIEKFKGSKYLQSDIFEASSIFLKDVSSDPSGKYICFGTPCQILGLKNLVRIKRLNNNIIFVDLFCHGVPSYIAWKSHLETLNKKGKTGNIDYVNFRSKVNGWHQYSIEITGSKHYKKLAYSDMFYRAFFDNLILNKSCYSCSVRKYYTAADIRLGDFHGSTYEHREDGVSAALVATDTGARLLKSLDGTKKITIDKVYPAETCLVWQNPNDYPNIALRDLTLEKLSSSQDLPATFKYYRSMLPMKHKIKDFLKILVGMAPNGLVIAVRKFYRQLKN